MPSRIRLTWNRNQDVETEYYRIFRDESPNIDHKNSRDKVIMIIQHPKVINPVTITNEVMERKTEKTYKLAHKMILIENKGVGFPFTIKIDGSDATDFILDREQGEVIFDFPVPEDAVVIAAAYTFDGVQVWDYDKTEEGKRYYGPEAKDTSPPSPPQNVTLDMDAENNRVLIKWNTAELSGKMLYYRIDAAIDEQRFSKMGDVKHVFLRESLADRPYIVERSEDGVRWMEVAKVKTNEFFEYSIDRKAPPSVRSLTHDVFIQQNQSEGQVELRWDPLLEDNSSSTSMYRVRARNKVGAVSAPSNIVGPVEMKVGISHVLIRRKIDDGTLPSYNGTDAETSAILTDLTKTSFTEAVNDNRVYMYGVWVVDKAGNYSPIAFRKVVVTDATPPAVPQNITMDEFHITAG